MPGPHRLLGQHRVDGDVLADVAEEVEQRQSARSRSRCRPAGRRSGRTKSSSRSSWPGCRPGCAASVLVVEQVALLGPARSGRRSCPVAPPARAIGRWPASWKRRRTSSADQVADVEAVGGGVEARSRAVTARRQAGAQGAQRSVCRARRPRASRSARRSTPSWSPPWRPTVQWRCVRSTPEHGIAGGSWPPLPRRVAAPGASPAPAAHHRRPRRRRPLRPVDHDLRRRRHACSPPSTPRRTARTSASTSCRRTCSTPSSPSRTTASGPQGRRRQGHPPGRRRRTPQQGEVVEGGSTITQQYVKNTLLDDDQDAQPQGRGGRCSPCSSSARYTKERILELYLNTIYFGNGAYGVQAAAQEYFGKPAPRLDLAQAALLAGLIQAPERHRPVRPPRRGAGAGATRCSTAWSTLGLIDAADGERGHAPPSSLLAERRPRSRYPAAHFVEQVKRFVLDDPRFGATAGRAATLLFGGGLRITTTLDLDLQAAAEQAVAGAARPRPGPTRRSCRSSRTGYVRALVGGRDFFGGGAAGQARPRHRRARAAPPARRSSPSCSPPRSTRASRSTGLPGAVHLEIPLPDGRVGGRELRGRRAAARPTCSRPPSTRTTPCTRS